MSHPVGDLESRWSAWPTYPGTVIGSALSAVIWSCRSRPLHIIRGPRFGSGSIFQSRISFWVSQQLPDHRHQQLCAPPMHHLPHSHFYSLTDSEISQAIFSPTSNTYVDRFFVCFFVFLLGFLMHVTFTKHGLVHYGTFQLSISNLHWWLAVWDASSCQIGSCLHSSTCLASSLLQSVSSLPHLSPQHVFWREISRCSAHNLFLFISQLWPCTVGSWREGKVKRERGRGVHKLFLPPFFSFK